MSQPDRLSAYRAARCTMVERQIESRGVHDPRVLAAMRDVPREAFLPPMPVEEVYSDRALPIDAGQTISQPYIVAAMTESLAPAANDVVLEIGTGSGYQTAILARLARHVHTVERIAELSRAAQARLRALEIDNVTFHRGDGSLGWPDEAPFDGILVSAGAPRVPDRLVGQLRPGARLVIPVGDEDTQTLVVVERTAHGTVERPLMACRFVKLIGECGWRAD